MWALRRGSVGSSNIYIFWNDIVFLETAEPESSHQFAAVKTRQAMVLRSRAWQGVLWINLLVIIAMGFCTILVT
jgi:hypothetical protein